MKIIIQIKYDEEKKFSSPSCPIVGIILITTIRTIANINYYKLDINNIIS